MSRKRFKADYESLAAALESFDQGDFDNALVRFASLNEISESRKIARRAWFGEICCRLILAETQAEYTAAIGMWHEFGNAAMDEDIAWGVSLLDPLIVRLTPPPQVTQISPPPEKTARAKQETVNANRKPTDPQPHKSPPIDRQLQDELAALKKKAEQVDQLQDQIDQIVAENQSLKKKIKALEAIDQTIQKKKTEISAPGE
jgi:regulator of protease activity HflC (stomatin/prohibitin superfamily)